MKIMKTHKKREELGLGIVEEENWQIILETA